MRIAVFIVSVLFLSACGGDSTEQPAEKTPAAKNGGVIPQHQLDAMQKAKDVGGVLQDADEKRREQLDSAN